MASGGADAENEAPPAANALSKLVRRLSKTMMVKPKDDVLEPERQESPEVAKLLLVLKDKPLRSELIHMLIASESDAIVKIRFCIAVNEYAAATNKADRQAKGRRIVALFIQGGSFFCLTGVPYSTYAALVHGKESACAEALCDLKAMFVDELASTPDVVRALQSLD